MGVRLVALVPVLGLLLSGCTGSAEEPLPEPPPFSASPTPSAVVLEVPPSARATDAVGAAAFARFYIEVLERAQRSGNTSQLRSLSADECDTCTNIIKATEQGASRGEVISGGAYTVLSAEASENEPGDAVVDMFYAREAFTRRGSSGSSEGGDAAVARDFLQMRCLRENGAWIVAGISFPEVPR